MSFYDAIRVGASGAADFEIERSLRFNDDDSPLLTRTFGSAGNRKTWTLSCWLKRSNIDTYQGLLAVGTVDGSEDFLGIDTSNRLNYRFNVGSDLKTLALFRDIGAWYHIVVVLDTTQSQSSASASDSRLRFYINGVRQTEWDESDMPSQNFETRINNNVLHYIGEYPRISSHLDGYLAEFNFIDGQAYDPTYFAETNEVTGQWIPKKYAGSYGTTGFRLQFADNSGTTATTLGKDTSGQGNNWTPSGFSVSAGVGNDSLEDTPTNNFATINSVFRVDGFDGNGSRTIKEGNLAISGATNNTPDALFAASIPFPLSGKWYVEANVTTLGATGGNEGGPLIGITDVPFTDTNSKSKMIRADGLVATTGNAGGAGSSQFTSSFGGSIAQGDVWQLAYDADNRYVYFGKNNSWANGSGSYNQSNFSNAQAHATQPTAGVQQVYVVCTPYSSASSISYQLDFNFGQRAFAHTPPTGYEKLNSTNLPDPTILLPNKHFDTLLYTGNSSTQSITGLDFAPDWVWIKERSSTSSHGLGDTVRGATKVLQSDLTDAEVTASTNFVSFDSNGFTHGNSGRVNESGQTYVAWNWNAGDTDGKTYTVKVVSDSGNKYRFDDFGTSAVTLDLAEGGTYTFDQSDSSMSSHPMQLSTTANGTHGGGSAYSTGVTYELDGSTVTASAFISGFSSASSRKLIITVAASAPTLYYYCYYHSGMGGAVNTNSTLGSSNFDGTIQTKVKVNASAGFSIINYTGNATAGSTVGHGLGVKPDFMILRNRPDVTNWIAYHSQLNTDGQSFLELNETQDGLSTSTTLYNSTAPSSSVITLGTNNASNGNNDAMLVYAFSEVAGYSKFGKYIGNGSSDGTFVFCGFRPAWLLIKKSSAAGSWVLWDNKRNPHNVCDIDINPNRNFQEDYYSNHDVDFLSNGFKLRYQDNTTNDNADTYVFIAFAKSPFKNARAR